MKVSTTQNQSNNSILIIGITGSTGVQCLHHLVKHTTKPKVHAFCRDPARLSNIDQSMCESIVTGNARNIEDVEDAIKETGARMVILATGSGKDLAKTDIRETSGKVLAQVLKKKEYLHVKAIVLSSNGAGDSRIKMGLGMGSALSFIIRNVNNDHTKQEAAFDSITERTLIVRPTGLTDNKAGKAVVEFGDTEKAPSIHIDRGDVAAWIVKEICEKPFVGGRKVNITTAKK